MRFEVRDLTVYLLPHDEGEGKVEDALTPGCCLPCTVSPEPCQCIIETEFCGTEVTCDNQTCGFTWKDDKAPAGRKSQAAYQMSLGLLREQLRQHLSQPGAF